MTRDAPTLTEHFTLGDLMWIWRVHDQVLLTHTQTYAQQGFRHSRKQ